MASRTAARLSGVTLTSPTFSRSAAVRAGLGVWPAAACWMALAMRARLLVSAMVSTSVVCEAPTMSLSRARFSASVAAVPMSAPMVAYCAAVGSLAGVASAVVSPAVLLVSLASARMALYASTMACTSAVVSAFSAVTGTLLSALLMAARFSAVTPVTPASTYCCAVGLVSLALLLWAASLMALSA